MSGQGPITGTARSGKPDRAENVTIRFLGEFCREHPLDEKIFILPSFSAGRQLGEWLARDGEGWVNLRIATLAALAHETAGPEFVRLGRRQMTETGLIFLVDAVFRELKAGGSLEYFDRLTARPGLARALLRAVQALRMSGMKSESLETGRFCVPSKGRDIVRLLQRFESVLDELQAFDQAGIFMTALASLHRENAGLSGRSPAWHLCLDNIVLTRVERDFLQAAAGERMVIVPRDPVFGLDRPRGRVGPAAQNLHVPRRENSASSSDIERLSWLFDPAGAPRPVGDGSVGFFRAVGQANECREVVRRIMAEERAFDSIEVVAPSGPVYPAIFHLTAARCGIPVTFAEGLPLVFTASGRALSGLADWIEGRFPVSGLCHILESGDLILPFGTEDENVSGERAARLLRAAMIGWGRGRYIERLDSYRRSLESDSARPARGDEDDQTPEAAEELRRTAREVGKLTEAMKELFAFLPESDVGGSVDFVALATGLASILKKCGRAHPGTEERDKTALRLLTDELGHMAEEDRALSGLRGLAAVPLRMADALERLRAVVSSLSVGASSPLPGHLHLSSFASGGYSGRAVTFVVGLNDTAAPGQSAQDPILLDAEREAISEFLPTTTDVLKSALDSLSVLLASLRGRVVLSYSSYDIMEERRLYPSSILLQALRLVRGDPNLDYSDLDRAFRAEAAEAGRLDPAGFIPDAPAKVIDERDWWLGRLYRDGRFLRAKDAVQACFPVLRGGVAAESARAGSALTAYEGLVKINRERFDPVVNHDLILSASRLELLAKCPYGYFLRYVLSVEPPRELELDRGRWLDPLQRGSLIHQVLFEFMAEVVRGNEQVSAAEHAPLMADIAGRVLRKWKAEVPPPSEGIFDKERGDILEALAIFLRVEGERDPRIRPVAFEKGFEAVAVDVGDGKSFLARGFIDRIDRTGPDTYRIVDYKTGSYREFDDFEAFGRGRKIQPALYALAAEDILGKETAGPKPRVTESGYLFPTRRGEGREIMVGTFDRNKLRELLGDMLALIAKGYFVTTTRDECTFCDYASICGGAFKRTKEKLEGNPEVAEALDKLKRYA